MTPVLLDPRYVVSADGKVYLTVRRGVEIPVEKRRPLTPFTLNVRGERLYVRLAGVNFPLNRIVAVAYVPQPPHHNHIRHIDGNKANCKAENLKWELNPPKPFADYSAKTTG